MRKKPGTPTRVSFHDEATLDELTDSGEGMPPPPFLENAPRALLTLQRKIHREKDVLWRLLTDPRMKRPWNEIAKRCSGTEDYRKLWGEIVNAIVQSHRPLPSRAQSRKHFKRIANDARTLASTIADGALDRLAFEYFPDDQARLAFKLKGNNWSSLESAERLKVADKTLAFWPSMTDVLQELARRAQMRAEEALTERRVVDRKRKTADRQVNAFVRHLAEFFRRRFGGPMKGTLSHIASVVLGQEIDHELVKRILRL